jgi:4-hydroxybenzoate polyprenyltransferase
MYGAYTNNLTIPLFLAGFGFAFLDIFGVCYNDYHDYETDIRNKRTDKWITAGLLTRKQMKIFSFLTLFVGLSLLFFTNNFVLAIGIYYTIILIGYSHPKIPLGRNIGTYLILGTYYLPLPYALSTLFSTKFTIFDIFFTLFCFFQAVYLITHKDVNDIKDDTNIFLGGNGTRLF